MFVLVLETARAKRRKVELRLLLEVALASSPAERSSTLSGYDWRFEDVGFCAVVAASSQ